MCSVLFLPVQSLLTCFRRSRFADFVSLSFVTNNSSSDSMAFLRFIAFSCSPTAVHRAFLFFDAKGWPQSQTDLFTCTTVLHCGHTFLRRIDLIYGKSYYTVGRAPNENSKVLRFQICCTRTKYLSEIYKNRTIKVGAAKLFAVNSSWT